MAAMLMLPTYGAMASSVKKEIYEKESAYKMDHWLWHALHDVTCIMVTVSILKLREKQISRELIFTLMERPKEKLSIFRS